MKITPHLAVAVLLLLVALVAAAGTMLDASARFPVSTHDQRVVGPAASTGMVPGERALSPLMPEFDGPIANPFSPRKGGVPTTAKIPLPPAPPLEVPPLPALPLSEK
jgi:hypothetical protein